MKAFLMLTGFIVVFLCPQLLFAYDVDNWLAKPSIRESYGSLEPEIRAAAVELRQLALAEDLLLLRLEEGAKKSVPPAVLQAGIRTDMENIRQTVRSLQARNLMPAREKDATRTVEKALLLLRAGIGAGEMEAALDAAAARAGPKGRQQPTLSRAFSALLAAASAKAAYGLSESSSRAFTAYLIASTLAERNFDSMTGELGKKIRGGQNADAAISSLVGPKAEKASPPDPDDSTTAAGRGATNNSGGEPAQGSSGSQGGTSAQGGNSRGANNPGSTTGPSGNDSSSGGAGGQGGAGGAGNSGIPSGLGQAKQNR